MATRVIAHGGTMTMVNALDSTTSSAGLNADRGHCLVLLCKALS